MEQELIMPGAVEVELGEFRLIPGPRGETGERGPRGYGIRSAVLNEDFTLTLSFEGGDSYTTPSIRGAQGVGVEKAEIVPGDYGVSPYDTLRLTMTDGTVRELSLYNAAAESARAAGESAEAAGESARAAREYSGRPPRIGGDGSWEIWDAGSGGYASTGLASRGPAGPEGPRGVGVESFELTSGDHGPGTTDTYTLTLTDGSETQVPVYNGADGEGTGDMKADVYDPQGRRTDLFGELEKYLALTGGRMTGSVTLSGKSPGERIELHVPSEGAREGDGTRLEISVLLGTRALTAGSVEDRPFVGLTDGSGEVISGLDFSDARAVALVGSGSKNGVQQPGTLKNVGGIDFTAEGDGEPVEVACRTDEETAQTRLSVSGGLDSPEVTAELLRLKGLQEPADALTISYSGDAGEGAALLLSAGQDVEITGVADPLQPNSAATRQYVDEAVAALRRELGLS